MWDQAECRVPLKAVGSAVSPEDRPALYPPPLPPTSLDWLPCCAPVALRNSGRGGPERARQGSPFSGLAVLRRRLGGCGRDPHVGVHSQLAPHPPSRLGEQGAGWGAWGAGGGQGLWGWASRACGARRACGACG
eukprot:gene15602-biopygen15748